MEKEIYNYLEKHKTEILEDLVSLVKKEASTSDIEALKAVREELIQIIQKRLNKEVIVHENARGHHVLECDVFEDEKPFLLVGHYDTVHSIGSVPIIVEEDCIKGPGILDMKAGLIQAIWTCKAMNDLNLKKHPIKLLFNGDEEIGSPSSKELIIEKAKTAKMAFVLEPGVEDGSIKTGRKGGARADITIFGKAAHAGNNPEKGINAILEMSHHIIALQKLNENEFGTTVNVGTIEGGSKSNVVPDEVSIKVDLRYKTKAEKERIKEAVLNIPLVLEGTRKEVEISEGSNPLEETEENLKLYEVVKEVSQKYGLEVGHRFVGGASDGNRIAEVDIPLLDGMGAIGKGIHAKDEMIDTNIYLKKIAILISTLQNLIA